MANEKITFIIVSWNNEDTIIECLDSIYKYCNDDFKIVLVDNNSTDNTVNIVKERRYNNCNIIELKENLGFAKGNNIGLETVDTEFICYLNPDTILLEDIVLPSINVLLNNSDIGIIGCKLLYKDKTLQPSTFNFINRKQIYYEAFKIGKFMPNFVSEKYFPDQSKCKKDKIVDWIIGAEMILRTDDARKIDGFSTEYYMYAEDLDLCKKMKSNLGKSVYYLANIKLIHIGGVSESKNVDYKKLEKLITNKIKFIEKFYGKRKALKTATALYNVYNSRMYLIEMFYWSNKEKRKMYIEKMKRGKIYSKEQIINLKKK